MKLMRFVSTLLVLFFISCATFKPQYAEKEDSPVVFPDKKVEKTFYLIGDAGYSPPNGMSKALTAFHNYVSDKKTDDDYAIFLGDNIYPAGLPNRFSKDRASAENGLNGQITSLENFNGNPIFIPGNHDWYSDGLNGLKREEKYIEKALGKNTFIPENGCPLESIDVSETIQLIIVDSEWYLENWNRNPTINDECQIKTRERFLLELEGELKKSEKKTTILAMHHPMYTNGVHGGYYPLKKHLYPTSGKLPLPILASLVTQIRTQGGVSIQDRYNESYNELMNRIEIMVSDSENVIIASGHEHSLQYIENENIKQIVSGSGAKESVAALGENGLFSYGKQGFVELTVFEDGSSWVRFYGVENDKVKLLYQKQTIEPRKKFDVASLPDSFSQTMDVSIYSEEETDKSEFFKSIWGEHYREMYSTKIKVEVATLDTLYGGLEVVRKGGGHQTRSLRLKTKDGKELNMRALRKSPTQFLQSAMMESAYVGDDYDKTLIERLVLDFYTAAHPYAFMMVPVLSHAAEVYHTNPKIFFIPKHKHLGEFNEEFGGELYLIEERPEENYSKERNFGYADDIESTHDIIEKIREDEKHKIDENAFIRARLFDMLIGDWDRHQDQWRWAQFDLENGDNLYRPIPRDRDQVFANFDGTILDVMRLISSSSNQLQVYDDQIDENDMKWMNRAGINLDRVLIQKSDVDAWIKQAKFLQDNITDRVIDEALLEVPVEVQDSTLLEIRDNLKARRENMVDIATRYHNFLNKLVVITGTDKDDYIDIKRIDNKKTQIKISRIINGVKGEVILDKTYDRDITEEIWIYGLDDNDVFDISGKANNLIFIRVIGGQGADTYAIFKGRRIKVYDHQSKENIVVKNKGGIIKFTDVYNLNLFDYKKHITKESVFSPVIGYNPDDGFLLGMAAAISKKGFQRNPFSQEHRFDLAHYFATSGFIINYNSEFANIMEDWNLILGGKVTTKNYTQNFFGFGNETVNLDNQFGMDYNRVRTESYKARVGMVKRGSFGSDYGFGVNVEGVKLADDANRFLSSTVSTTESNYDDFKYFTSIGADYDYLSYDNKQNPTRGMRFGLHIGGTTDLQEVEDVFGYINTNIGFYNAISKNRKLVLKTDVRAQFRIGNDYQFYQASSIGASNGLRGYRDERFTGKNAFLTSADLRYTFKSIKTSTFPIQIGMYGGFDVGRVWLSDNSKKWHNDYGGGLWISAANSISGSFNLFNSSEGMRFSFGLGVDLNLD